MLSSEQMVPVTQTDGMMTPPLESLFDPTAPTPQPLIRPTSASVLVQVIPQLSSRVKLCISRGNSAMAVVAIFNKQVFPPLSTECAWLLLFLDVMILSARSLFASSTKGFSTVLWEPWSCALRKAQLPCWRSSSLWIWWVTQTSRTSSA